MLGKKVKYVLAIIAMCGFVSCRVSPLEQSLRFAEGNREELEQVLDYYKNDSLKHQAASFLIQNMPYHYSLESEKLNCYRNEFYPICLEYDCTAEEGYRMLQNRHGKLYNNEYVKIFDSHVITADFLISNIEFSFKVWEENPWKHLITFEEFCEHILPYRVCCEPLENWKEKYYQVFKPVLDSLLIDKSDPLEACEILYKKITSEKWIFTEKKLLPYMGAMNLLEKHIGNCDDRAQFAFYVMSSLGLPGGIDCVLQQPNRYPKGHSWNFVLDSAGNTVEFTLYDQPPIKTSHSKYRGKVYRKTFSAQNKLSVVEKKEENIPASLNNELLMDVSENYFPNSFSLEITFYQPHKRLYLCVFNNKEWIPVAWLQNKKNVLLQNVESDIMYLMGYFQNGCILPASYPIKISNDSCYELIKLDRQKTQEVKLTRKYPLKPWWKWIEDRSLNGKFQVSNYADFRDSVTIFQVKHGLDMVWHNFHLKVPALKRYIRYLSAENSYCSLAEIEVYVDGEIIQNAKVIGTDGSYRNNSLYEKEAIYDKDPLTFYDAKEATGSWAGLDLREKKGINEVRYIFRNDDNSIRIGDVYELFYWDNAGWVSLGKQTAMSDELFYSSCPIDALLLLRNHTRGVEERIFLYKNDQQEWW